MSLTTDTVINTQSRYPAMNSLIQRNIGGASELWEKASNLKSKGKVELARTVLRQGAIQFIRSNDFTSGAILASAYYRTFGSEREKYFAALNLVKSAGRLSTGGESEVLVGIAGDRNSTHPFKKEIVAIVEPLKFAKQVWAEKADLRKTYSTKLQPPSLKAKDKPEDKDW